MSQNTTWAVEGYDTFEGGPDFLSSFQWTSNAGRSPEGSAKTPRQT